MKTCRAAVAWALSFLLFPLPSAASDSVKQQVNQLGVGAKVKVKLAGGVRLRGSIEAIEAGGFLLRGKGPAAKPVSYDQLARIELAANTYNVSHGADVTQARRVIAALGAGKHIVMKVAGGREYHGNIQQIEVDHFMMLPDAQTTPLRVAYSDVTAAGPNLSKGAKIAIVVVIGLAIAVAVIAEVAIHGKKINGI